MKRYNLALPEELFSELQNLADDHHTTVAELLRKFIKLGLLALKLQEDQDTAFGIKTSKDTAFKEILVL